MSLKDKHVVVTGGTGALGRAVVQALLENHAIVHVTNNDSRELDGFPHKAHPRVRIARGVDLTNEGQVEADYGGRCIWQAGSPVRPCERPARPTSSECSTLTC